jgi:hypothetical protein
LVHLAQSEYRSFSSLLGRVLPTLPVKVDPPVIGKAADLEGANSAILSAASRPRDED